MKKIFLIVILLGFYFCLSAQPNRDSIFSRQMNLFKNQLQLSSTQFSNFKTAHTTYQNQANGLNASGFDTASLRQKFILIKNDLYHTLTNILTNEQYIKYLEKVNRNVQAFKNEAEKNKIQVISAEAAIN